MVESKNVCPECGSGDVVPIEYGLPGPEMMQAAGRGEVHLGGCVVAPDSPDLRCGACGHEWLQTVRVWQ